MLPFTANEQVLYSAIPEMHSRHGCLRYTCRAGLSGKQSAIIAIIFLSGLGTLMIRGLPPDKTI